MKYKYDFPQILEKLFFSALFLFFIISIYEKLFGKIYLISEALLVIIGFSGLMMLIFKEKEEWSSIKSEYWKSVMIIIFALISMIIMYTLTYELGFFAYVLSFFVGITVLLFCVAILEK